MHTLLASRPNVVASTRIDATRRARCERAFSQTVLSNLSFNVSSSRLPYIRVHGYAGKTWRLATLKTRCKFAGQNRPKLNKMWQIVANYWKGKGLNLYSASSWTHLWSAQVWITQLLHCKAHGTCLYRVIRQSAHKEGATTEWTVIAPADEAYNSFIDPVRMKGWVGLVGCNGWPTADGLPI